jgi:hypothetical protein
MHYENVSEKKPISANEGASLKIISIRNITKNNNTTKQKNNEQYGRKLTKLISKQQKQEVF